MKFSEILGQEEVKNQVRDAVAADRLPHALMLVGPEGVGKFGMATAIAQYINCLQPTDGDSCGTCANCIKIAKGIHPDLHYVLPIISRKEGNRYHLTDDYFPTFRDVFFDDPYLSFSQWKRLLDGENKQLFVSVHEIRELKRKIALKAFEAPYKVILIWNAEQIRREGANAFLKLLEEPPERTQIIMTCSDPSRLLTTINSRVQRMQLSRIPVAAIRQYLQDKHQVDEDQADELASISEGSPAIANEYLSESSQQMSSLYIEWLRAVYLGQYDKIQDRIEPIIKENKEFQKLFLSVAMKKLRDSLLFHLGSEKIALSTRAEQEFQEKFSKLMSADKVAAIARRLDSSHRHLSGNANAHMIFSALSMEIHRILRA